MIPSSFLHYVLIYCTVIVSSVLLANVWKIWHRAFASGHWYSTEVCVLVPMWWVLLEHYGHYDLDIQGVAKNVLCRNSAITHKWLSISVRNFPQLSVRVVCIKSEDFIKFCWSVYKWQNLKYRVWFLPVASQHREIMSVLLQFLYIYWSRVPEKQWYH